MQSDGVSVNTGVPKPLIRMVRAYLRWRAVNQNVVYGRNFRVGRKVVLSSAHGLNIGDNVSIGPYSIVQVDGKIGDYTLIGMHVYVAGRADHELNAVGVPIALGKWVGDRPQKPSDVITVGRDVWIGARAVVLSGVTIGDGAVVGAGSLVISDVDAFTIVAGSPARAIGQRFDTDAERNEHLGRLDVARG